MVKLAINKISMKQIKVFSYNSEKSAEVLDTQHFKFYFNFFP